MRVVYIIIQNTASIIRTLLLFGDDNLSPMMGFTPFDAAHIVSAEVGIGSPSGSRISASNTRNIPMSVGSISSLMSRVSFGSA